MAKLSCTIKLFSEKGGEHVQKMENLIRAPDGSPWGDVQQHIRLANGAFEVQTARHGGVMIDATLARQMLSKEALEVGFVENGFYCFEEDADAQVPLKELFEAGLMYEKLYFSRFKLVFNDGETLDSFIQRWKENIDIEVENYHPDYFYKDVKGTSFSYHVVNNEAIIDRYTGSDINVVIPSEIDGYKVTKISDNAFRHRKKLESVIIPNSVECVCDGAFHGCSSLDSVEIVNGTKISEDVFPRNAVITRREKSFAEQVDDALAGKFNQYDDLKVCDTPQILLDVGCRQLPMLYTQRHLRDAIRPRGTKGEAIHYHGLDIELLKKVPEAIINPVMVYDSLSKGDSIVILTDLLDKENNPLIVSVRPNGRGHYELKAIPSNFVTSIHGRENIQTQIERAVSKNKILYCNKEKSQELFSLLGLRLSQCLNDLDSNVIIHQSRNIIKPFEEKAKNTHNVKSKKLEEDEFEL